MKEGAIAEFDFNRYTELFRKNLYAVATDEEKEAYAQSLVTLNRFHLELNQQMVQAAEKGVEQTQELGKSHQEMMHHLEQITDKQTELLTYLKSDPWGEQWKTLQKESPREYALSTDSMVQLSVLNALTVGCVLWVGYALSRVFGGIS